MDRFLVDTLTVLAEPPVMSENDHSSPRRRFLERCAQGSIALGTCVIAWPVYRYLLPPPLDPPDTATSLALGPSRQLLPRQARSATLGSIPIIVLRLEDGSLRAFDATCPHLGCEISFDPENRLLQCPCHGAAFHPDTGAAQHGPTTAPLRPIPLQVRHDTIIVGT
ncbi:MAG TPA: Rieske (2Fe-2S) protein [Polyangiaceae bacterium]|nr:MAG: Cytochrome b6-f complex iron-sulfur subunit [Deltaproteobacteria bacterium ADurb.Bin207]HNS98100.1 Rieske (2Fe-2S) protein [Polyangiaceae bacterium]HNZ24025.1 Rieske (2Fe-2S) protein [Polyangiaceae bacterium]HOD21816.1 Rieske (2Fe-2S) protein [Polyangiaceae bacterium]HOE50911.1 Rieske (2Fe-2S) protein [Polyangiaceae bacterium]